ncbi:nuclease-related domain-containing protein [Salisediminibacterium halotolerans]|uniref:Nuclease-related domain-containing protein n=1 Tax=Salisediminibacterium halotolerans TaxID=517425 RepID=A0A1H9TT88_9BACI|nr:nuclease-related domain-containing protein [Salisediminibacterium haloalkalitolerans]SES00254.1 Nuclease-related domain-containing protein [Salisediminibacterium haloalkalitolerans]
MIIKERTVPQEYMHLKCLLRRIADGHPKKAELETLCRHRKWGYLGEEKTDYYTRLYDDRDTYIFKALKLPHKAAPFEIDSLLLFPEMIFLIETKCWSGTYAIQPNGDFRRSGGDDEVEPNPAAQAFLRKEKLEQLLKDRAGCDLPVDYTVFFANDKLQLTNTQNLAGPHCKSAQLIRKIDNLRRKYRSGKTAYTPERLEALAQQINAWHIPDTYAMPAAERLGLGRGDIQTGVQCPVCLRVMTRLPKTWRCPACKTFAPAAHTRALVDYMFLYSRFITAADASVFLGVPDQLAASRLVEASGAVKIDRGEDAVYDLGAAPAVLAEIDLD